MNHASHPDRPGFLPWTASVALLLALLTALAAQTPAATVATVTALEGLAEVVLPGAARPVPARLDMRVAAGSTVRT